MPPQNDTMRAMVFTDYRQMQVQDLPIPRPGPGEALIRVRAAGICGSDLHGYTGQSGRRKPPLVMGHEAAGEIVDVMGDVMGDAGLASGTRVAIQPLVYRDGTRYLIGMTLPGAYAEYVIAPASNLYPIPDSLPFTTAALTEPLAVCVHAVSLVQVRPYDAVLVIGGGAIGLLTAQVLRLAGAGLVAVSDVSAERLAIARQMGFVTLNPAQADLASFAREQTSGRGFDLVYEAVGLSATVQQATQAVRDGGTIVWIGNNQRMVEVDMQAIVTREIAVRGTYGMNEADFQRALRMLADERIEAGAIVNRRATLAEGATLFDELLASPQIVKCVIDV